MTEKVTVLGAGTMGHGIAQLYAQAGYDVFLYDIKAEFLTNAVTRISMNLNMLIQEGVIGEKEKESALSHVFITTNLEEAVKDTTFVTEAASENLDVKFSLFNQLEELVEDDTVIASNTSTFSLRQLSEGIQKKNRLIITHFFNPAQIVPLVEVVKGPDTPQEMINRTVEILKSIGKKPVVLKKDIPGFIANRLQAALVREAFYLLDEGIASAEDIDSAITDGPGFRWSFIGPLETADFGGLDIWKSVVENLAPELSKEIKIPAFVEDKVQSGNLGIKTGSGLFTYAGDEEIQQKIKQRDENFVRLAKIKNT
jgi:3-hydroxybutyryl-CoA dehydrogenase